MYGCPSTVTIDGGQKFQSHLLSFITSVLDTEWMHRGIGRFHCQLKAAPKYHENRDWCKTFPLVLLRIRHF